MFHNVSKGGINTKEVSSVMENVRAHYIYYSIPVAKKSD